MNNCARTVGLVTLNHFIGLEADSDKESFPTNNISQNGYENSGLNLKKILQFSNIFVIILQNGYENNNIFVIILLSDKSDN